MNATNDITTVNTVLSNSVLMEVVPEEERSSGSISKMEIEKKQDQKAQQLNEIQFQMQEAQLRFEELRK